MYVCMWYMLVCVCRCQMSVPGVLPCHSPSYSHLTWSCTDSQNTSATCLHRPHCAVDTGTLATVPGFLCRLQTQAPLLAQQMITDPSLQPQS